ncbi:MAG: helix-turn-helix domain-containing protein [Anaerolineales bacterium]|nr:helix-turn-helix domain-containing protein [Anaerolineales bacterium]
MQLPTTCLLVPVTLLGRQETSIALSGRVTAPAHCEQGHCFIEVAVAERLVEAEQTTHLLRAREVAKILNVSQALAYRLMQMGEIPCVRIGTAVRVRPEDLEAYIHANLSTGI